jgi:serine/threonine protein kinase
MALTSGTKLGPYEIQSPLGAGGMGEVYRARDTRLDRTVAIKVLPSHLSADPELKQRFDREAKAISALQHPNICTLHDVGSQNGVDFLVMEYLEGQTLADRLAKGALPLDQALKIGAEIAEALEKAHRQGIVHRDLKPGNIMLTKSGAKLMDFGLAKPELAIATGARGQLTPSTPTMNLASLTSAASPLTQKGSIVGTFQYLSPEVLQGSEADARSDIFSFGCVLYEMVAGRRAFEGKSQLGVFTAILEKEPEPITASQPPALDRVIRACLAKDPADQFPIRTRCSDGPPLARGFRRRHRREKRRGVQEVLGGFGRHSLTGVRRPCGAGRLLVVEAGGKRAAVSRRNTAAGQISVRCNG